MLSSPRASLSSFLSTVFELACLGMFAGGVAVLSIAMGA